MKQSGTQGEERVCRGGNSLTALSEMLLRLEHRGYPGAHLENMPMEFSKVQTHSPWLLGALLWPLSLLPRLQFLLSQTAASLLRTEALVAWVFSRAVVSCLNAHCCLLKSFYNCPQRLQKMGQDNLEPKQISRSKSLTPVKILRDAVECKLHRLKPICFVR